MLTWQLYSFTTGKLKSLKYQYYIHTTVQRESILLHHWLTIRPSEVPLKHFVVQADPLVVTAQTCGKHSVLSLYSRTKAAVFAVFFFPFWLTLLHVTAPVCTYVSLLLIFPGVSTVVSFLHLLVDRGIAISIKTIFKINFFTINQQCN